MWINKLLVYIFAIKLPSLLEVMIKNTDEWNAFCELEVGGEDDDNNAADFIFIHLRHSLSRIAWRFKRILVGVEMGLFLFLFGSILRCGTEWIRFYSSLKMRGCIST